VQGTRGPRRTVDSNTYMNNSRSIAALAGALVLVCAVVALEWYSHVGGASSSVPKTVQAVTAAPSAQPVPSQRPVVYVPMKAASSPSAPPAGSPSRLARPENRSAATAPQTPKPLEAGATVAPQAIAGAVATLAPTAVLPPVLREPTDAPPRILAMSLSSPVAHGGDVVSGIVETSSNVASVEARIGGYATSMQKVGTGRFQLSYRVPNLPFFLHRTYMIQVIARNTKGQEVSSALPITVR